MRRKSPDLTCSNKFKQFLARISNHMASGLSEHNHTENHIELKGPNKDDPVIRFNIFGGRNIEDGNIRFW